MKDRMLKNLPMGTVVGLVYAAVSFFTGGVRYHDSGFPPIWLQLLCNGAIFAVVYTVVGAAVDLLLDSYKKRRK